MTTAAATTSPSQPPLPDDGQRGRSLWRDAWRRITGDWVAVTCLVVIALYVLIALGGFAYNQVAEWDDTDDIRPFEEVSDYANANHEPTFGFDRYFLGADWEGKSTLLKTLLAAKTSLTIAVLANIIAVPIGMVLGAVAGFYGRRLDDLIVWLYTTLGSIPGLILLIAIKFAFQDIVLWEDTPFEFDLGGIHGIYIALGVISWIGTCRLVRAETMKIRELDYVLAARAIGTPNFVILLRHVMPNVLHLGIIRFSLGFVGAIAAEVTLSYLGLGVEVGTPSWGSMINAARMDLMNGRWWEVTSAVAAMFFLVLALNIFGDRLRDALDPRLRNV